MRELYHWKIQMEVSAYLQVTRSKRGEAPRHELPFFLLLLQKTRRRHSLHFLGGAGAILGH